MLKRSSNARIILLLNSKHTKWICKENNTIKRCKYEPETVVGRLHSDIVLLSSLELVISEDADIEHWLELESCVQKIYPASDINTIIVNIISSDYIGFQEYKWHFKIISIHDHLLHQNYNKKSGLTSLNHYIIVG